MITRERIFNEGFVPNDIVHRNQETEQLARIFNPLTRGDRPEDAFLSGPPGTGKSCIAQFTLNQLREEAPSVTTQYVNCWTNHSRFNTLYYILKGVKSTVDVHRQSTPTDVLLDRLRNASDTPYVVILDEVDQLEDRNLLYDLHRMSDLWMILIANESSSFMSQLDDRLRSRLRPSARIEFNPYETQALVSILQARADAGLRPDAVERHHLEIIAGTADGDARLAIQTLYAAARRAERERQDILSKESIQDAISEARTNIRQKNIESLKDHQKVLYDIITEYGEVKLGELYGQYEERVSSPKTKRTVRDYLSKMRHCNLIVSEGEKRGTTHRLISERDIES